ncbi:PREDICTED: LOW QUALITY PROTEIN: uncharacterized protein LOC104793610 [Camelina sativa]|uniref:LOW QUALITY PROTEIN: uncharacterized protein LOC104793610 n=1 Tax=Camelina sativa TaxID=90675 RepID=A0ABM0ZNN0_CAMSA|nr:PREDICTED: LOW QUALITY PROTEIN: uncharacterized protein LOC104793610 [Camelina sativa]
MDSSREANRKHDDDKKREDEIIVALAHEARESRARANKRFIKETKLMEKRTHVLHPMAKDFRHYRKM